MASVTIGTAAAAPGEVARGAIPVASLAGGTPVEIPVIVINGAAPGRTFWVDGAIHGDEPEGPYACQLAVAEIDPDKLAGTVVLCPVLNVPAFEAADRGNPLDTFSYDMNRIYPGRANGYLTERIAAAHAHWLGQHADLEITIHSGGAHSYLAKAIFLEERPESVELATAMGPGWGCMMSANRSTGSPMAYLGGLGKIAITVELGGRSATSPTEFDRVGKELCASILNILRHYQMYPGAASYPSPRYKGVQEALLAPASGIFLPAPGVEFLTMMKKGDPIASIVNLFGDVEAELTAPADGMFFGLRALRNVTIGDWCCFFCKVEGTRD